MIAKKSYTTEWITALRSKIGNRTDPKLIEKVIRALGLLEQLRHLEMELIFKGGTSILLASEYPTRFSIDIDIITEHSHGEIASILDKVIENSSFTDWKPDNDRKQVTEAPLGHFKLYYTSVVDGKIEPILLDVLYSPNPYLATREIPVSHPWLLQEGKPVTVCIPTFDAILGDKLTAFAPETTGILYTKNRPVEIIKQLYDISFLFEKMQDIHIARESFMKIVGGEIAFRNLDIHWHHVLEDIERTSYTLVERDQKSAHFIQLQTGIRNITNFIIGRFGIDEAITAAAKAAYFSALIRTGFSGVPNRYNFPAEITQWEIKNHSRPKLSKLKKSNPEAFFYWYHTSQLSHT